MFTGPAALVGLALTTVVTVTAAGNGPSLHAGGFYAGGAVHGGVHAQTRRDGTVTGQVEGHNSAIGFDFHGVVNCLYVDGNTAIIIGVVTDGFRADLGLDVTGWSFAWGMRDNGEGAGAEPDLIGFFFLRPLAIPPSTLPIASPIRQSCPPFSARWTSNCFRPKEATFKFAINRTSMRHGADCAVPEPP